MLVNHVRRCTCTATFFSKQVPVTFSIRDRPFYRITDLPIYVVACNMRGCGYHCIRFSRVRIRLEDIRGVSKFQEGILKAL
jgi:hypothetical protein